MKNVFKNLSVAAGLAAGFLAFSSASALAQCEKCPEIGTPINCPGISKSQLEALGYTITLETQTDGTFIITSCTPPPPGCPQEWETELQIDKFEGTGYSDDLKAKVVWRNDPQRDVYPASGFKGYDPKEQFPAYGFIQFYAECEVEGIPGVFRSEEPVRLINEKVMSFSPFKGELFVKDPDTKPVVFVNEEAGEKIILNDLNSYLSER